MSKTDTVSPLRQRMIEDMAARKLDPHTQRSHISSCKRFAAWLKRSPDTATAEEVRRFQLYLIESGASIRNRNRIMTGVRFLFRVTLRGSDLVAEQARNTCSVISTPLSEARPDQPCARETLAPQVVRPSLRGSPAPPGPPRAHSGHCR